MQKMLNSCPLTSHTTYERRQLFIVPIFHKSIHRKYRICEKLTLFTFDFTFRSTFNELISPLRYLGTKLIYFSFGYNADTIPGGNNLALGNLSSLILIRLSKVRFKLKFLNSLELKFLICLMNGSYLNLG